MTESVSEFLLQWPPANLNKKWPGHTKKIPYIVDALVNHSGIIDNSGIHDYFNDYFASNFEKIEKKIVISAGDVNTGEYVPFTEAEGFENLGWLIQASTSCPPTPPTIYKDKLLMDGGTIWNIDIDYALDRCREVVADDEHIIMDIIITNYESFGDIETTGTTRENMDRIKDMQAYYKRINDVAE